MHLNLPIHNSFFISFSMVTFLTMFLFKLTSHKAAALELGITNSNSSLIHRNALNMMLLVMLLIGERKVLYQNV